MHVFWKSAGSFVVTLGAAAVALVMSGVQKVGQAQDEAAAEDVPVLMPDELEVGFTAAEYHEAICNAVELMAEERAEDVGDTDFTLWKFEPCTSEVTYG